MKTPWSRPRLSCQLARSCVTAFGDGSGKGPGSQHISTCRDCQEFFATCDDLDLALRRDAAPYQAAPDAGFEQRLLRAIRMSEPVSSRPNRHVAWLSFAGMTACAAVAAIVLLRHPPGTTTPEVAVNSSSSTVTDVLTAAGLISDRMWNSLKPSAVALAEKNPLEHELDSVYSDARSALGFLALNFFPAELSLISPEPEISGSSQRG